MTNWMLRNSSTKPLEEITSRYSANKSPSRLTTVQHKVLKVYWWEQRKQWGSGVGTRYLDQQVGMVEKIRAMNMHGNPLKPAKTKLESYLVGTKFLS